MKGNGMILGDRVLFTDAAACGLIFATAMLWTVTFGVWQTQSEDVLRLARF